VIPDPLFLGVDLGTSSLKCGLFDLTGHRAGAARISYPTHEWDGGAEQQAGDWWQALVQSLRLATAEVDRRRIAAISVGGHAPSPVFVDADLEPVGPVLPWFDGRSQAERERLLQILGRQPENGPERLMMQVAARAGWLRSKAPGEFARAASVLHSGDYLVARLTGQSVITSPKAPDAFVAANLPLGLFPERECRPGEVVGRVSLEAARPLGLHASVEVISGGLDSFLASVGSGMCEPGDACLNTGSSSVVALLGRPDCAGRFEWAGFQLLSRPLPLGGRTLDRASRHCGRGDSLADLLPRAAQMRPSPRIHDLLPEFIRAAHHPDREVQRLLAEMAERDPPFQMFRLLLDAIFLSQRKALEELQQQGEPARRIRAVGGLAAYADLNQLQADVLGKAVEVPRTTDSGALGAAMLAAAGLGYCAPAEAASRMARTDRVYYPRKEFAVTYEALFREILAGAAGSIS
jgi:xylulokinase